MRDDMTKKLLLLMFVVCARFTVLNAALPPEVEKARHKDIVVLDFDPTNADNLKQLWGLREKPRSVHIVRLSRNRSDYNTEQLELLKSWVDNGGCVDIAPTSYPGEFVGEFFGITRKEHSGNYNLPAATVETTVKHPLTTGAARLTLGPLASRQFARFSSWFYFSGDKCIPLFSFDDKHLVIVKELGRGRIICRNLVDWSSNDGER